MDFWRRGIGNGQIAEGDNIVFDGLISPYAQLFPDNPLSNAIRWNQLYNFHGKITKEEYQAMDFYAGSDAALRVGSLNGETLVGLYSRYGYIGEGLVGVASTTYLRKKFPNFYSPDFFGARARVYGKVSRCPSQHKVVAQAISIKTGITFVTDVYKKLYYLQIQKIQLPSRSEEKVCTLLGSPWAVTESENDQFLVQYTYVSDPKERRASIENIVQSPNWNHARIFFDDIESPSDQLGFKRNFIL